MSNRTRDPAAVCTLFLLLLAFGLRIYAIDRQDIWGDEAVSIQLSRGPLPQVLASGAETVPPLYHLFLYGWIKAAGISPLAIRFLSAAFSTLAVAVTGVLGRRIGGRPLAVLGCLLAAISPALVYYSQEARVYSVLTFFTVLSVYLTLRLIESHPHPREWVAYTLTSLAAGYTHYYAFFVVLAENVVMVPYLIRQRRYRNLGHWIAAQGVIIIATVPWLLVQANFLSGKAGTRFDQLNLAVAADILKRTLAMFGAGLAVPPDVAGWITIPFLLAALGCLVAGIKRPLEKVTLLVILLLPFLLAWLVNPIMPFFFPRYLLLVAPAFYLLAAWGIISWGKRWRPAMAVGAIALVAGSLWGLRGTYTDDAYLKGRYGQMMAFIGDQVQPGDGLLLVNQLQRPLYAYYQPDELEGHFFPRYEYPLTDPRTALDLSALAAEHPRLWLVRFGNPAEYDPDGFMHRWLSIHGSKAYAGGWVDAELSLYVMRSAAAEGDIEHPLAADLGGLVRLLGYSLSTERVVAGDTLLLTLFWRAEAPMTERYTVFTHLLDYRGEIQAQMDSEPQGGGLPTDRWVVGQVVEDNYALSVSPDASTGAHALEVGMYLWVTGDRLPVLGADSGEPLGDRVLLGTVEVMAP